MRTKRRASGEETDRQQCGMDPGQGQRHTNLLRTGPERTLLAAGGRRASGTAGSGEGERRGFGNGPDDGLHGGQRRRMASVQRSVSAGRVSAGPAVSLREQQKQSGMQNEAQASVDAMSAETAAEADAGAGRSIGSQAASRVTSPQTTAASSNATSRGPILRQTLIGNQDSTGLSAASSSTAVIVLCQAGGRSDVCPLRLAPGRAEAAALSASQERRRATACRARVGCGCRPRGPPMQSVAPRP